MRQTYSTEKTKKGVRKKKDNRDKKKCPFDFILLKYILLLSYHKQGVVKAFKVKEAYLFQDYISNGNIGNWKIYALIQINLKK